MYASISTRGAFRLGVIVLLQTVDGGWDVWTTGEGSGEEAWTWEGLTSRVNGM